MVVIKGGGDLGSGVAHRLLRSGFPVTIVDQRQPTMVRREVSFAAALGPGWKRVEGITARDAGSVREARALWRARRVIPVLAGGRDTVKALRPDVLVDATMNGVSRPSTRRGDAPLTIALGPGYRAGRDVDLVVETNRGHDLGRLLTHGSAAPLTGTPGEIAGQSSTRVLRSPSAGRVLPVVRIGSRVRKGQVVAWTVNGTGRRPVKARISGLLRGLMGRGCPVVFRQKVGDIDPRGVRSYAFTISDKSRAVAGGVLEGIIQWQTRNN